MGWFEFVQFHVRISRHCNICIKIGQFHFFNTIWPLSFSFPCRTHMMGSTEKLSGNKGKDLWLVWTWFVVLAVRDYRFKIWTQKVTSAKETLQPFDEGDVNTKLLQCFWYNGRSCFGWFCYLFGWYQVMICRPKLADVISWMPSYTELREVRYAK